MRKHLKSLIIFVLTAAAISFLAYGAMAAGSIFGGLEGARKSAGFSAGATVESQVGNVISVVLEFVGVIFLGLMLYGGFVWMIARGNEQEIEKAKRVLESAVIGLAVVAAAYTITYFVVQHFAPTPGPGVSTCAEGETDCTTACTGDTYPEDICVQPPATCTCSGATGGGVTCTPTVTSCDPGQCGTRNDGCGGIIDCPACPEGETCAVGTCVAAPTEETETCNCCTSGSRADQTMSECFSFCGGSGRGGVRTWGSTTISCGGGGGAPPCTPTTCAAVDAECGSISDGCGGSLNCGRCSSPEYSCNSNRCELAYADCTCCADGISRSSITLSVCVALCLPHGGPASWDGTSHFCP